MALNYQAGAFLCKKFSRQRGSSLMEMIIIISLVVLFVMGVMSFYKAATHSSRVEEIISDIASITSVIRSKFKIQANYEGINSSVVSGFLGVPESMLSSSGGLKHPFSAELDAVRIESVSPFESVIITFEGLTPEACYDLAVRTHAQFIRVASGGQGISDSNSANTICFSSSAPSLSLEFK